MTKRVDTPSISADLTDEESQAQFRESVKECVEVLEGKRGDGLDRAITARDLSEAGLIEVRAAVSSNGGSNSGIGIVAPVPTVSFPTTPTNLVISGAFTNLLLVWDAATFQGYAHTEVWRADTDSLPAAVKIATSSYHMFSDPVEPNSSFFYWIRFANTANQKGAYNAVNGTAGTTDKKVSTLLSELNDHIPADVLILDDGTVAGKAPFITVYGDGLAIGTDGTQYLNKTQAWQVANHPSGKWFAAGSYMQSAMIADASIDVAKIHNLTVDMANVTGTLTADMVNADFITAEMLHADAIDAEIITINNNIAFSGQASGLHFGKTSLGDQQAGAFFGRAGSVTGFSVSSATSGIYADSTGQVNMNNVRMYAGAAGEPAVFPNTGTFTRNISGNTSAITVIIIGGGGGACNNSNNGTGSSPYGARAGASGTASWIKWYSGQDGTGTVLGTYNAAGGAGTPAASVGSNNSSASGRAGQASSKAAGGAGGTYGYNYSGSPPTSGTFGSGGGGAAAITTNSATFDAPVNVQAGAGATISQVLQKPNGAQSIEIRVGIGGAGGQGFSQFIGGNGNQQGTNITGGGSGGDGWVSVADPNSGGIEVDLLSIVNRLTAAGI
jgi:hypothetical protein